MAICTASMRAEGISMDTSRSVKRRRPATGEVSPTADVSAVAPWPVSAYVSGSGRVGRSAMGRDMGLVLLIASGAILASSMTAAQAAQIGGIVRRAPPSVYPLLAPLIYLR